MRHTWVAASAMAIATLLATGCAVSSVPEAKPGIGVQQPPATSAEAVPGPSYNLLANSTPIKIGHELMITDLGVIEDSRASGAGPWSFATLIRNMAGTTDPSAFVENWLAQIEVDQLIANDPTTVAARPSIRTLVLDPWPKTLDGKLDLEQAPFRLLAIVNRIDLRKKGNAGEARFVFGLTDPQNLLGDERASTLGDKAPFTVIFEYGVPLTGGWVSSPRTWAQQWHALGAHTLGSPEYNAALQAITDQFSGQNAVPSRPNGSALNQLRTNEVALASPWEMREFRLQPNGALKQVPVAQNPQLTLNNTASLAAYLNKNSGAILNGTYTVPASLLAGSALVPLAQPVIWNAPGVKSSAVRQKFAVNTCNGCHLAETGTTFLHVGTREAGAATPLSGFLTGITLPNPAQTSENVSFNDLANRAAVMQKLLDNTNTNTVEPSTAHRVH